MIFIAEQNLVGLDGLVSAVMLSPLRNSLHMTDDRANCVKT